MSIKTLFRIFWINIIAFTILYGIFLRVRMYELRRGFSGEDTFSLLRSARALTHFSYPATEKRLPLYPFLLTPVANNPIIAIEYGKILSVIFGSLTLLLTAIFTYQLSKSYVASAVSTLLLSLNVSLIIISARALTDALFILLNTFCFFFAYLYLKKVKSRGFSILFGLFLGLAAMTRFEGFLTALLFLGSYFLYFKIYRKNIIIAGVIFFCVVTPWFIKNTIQYKNPFSSPYLKDAEYGVKGSANFKEKVINGFYTVPTLFFKFDSESPRELKEMIKDEYPNMWKIHNIKTFILPKLAVMLLAYVNIILVIIGGVYLIRKYKVYGFSYLITAAALYAIAMFIWLRVIARFYNSQLPLFSILIGLGIAVLVRNSKNMKRTLLVFLLCYLFYQMFFSLQKEVRERLITERTDSYDSAIYLEYLGYLHKTNKKVITNIDDHNVIPFYIKNVVYVRDKDKYVCENDKCLYLTETEKKPKGTILKSHYQKNKALYLSILK